MVPCKVTLLVVLLKSMMMADVMVACMDTEVHLEAVVAVRCKRNREHVSCVCGCGGLVSRSNRSGLLGSRVR